MIGPCDMSVSYILQGLFMHKVSKGNLHAKADRGSAREQGGQASGEEYPV